MPLRRTGRLPNVSYVGLRRYFLTFCTARRERHFRAAEAVEAIRRQLLHTADAHTFAVSAYCFMPDHLHALTDGLTDASDLQAFVRQFKQRTGFDFRRQFRKRLWQSGYYDHILRSEQATLRVARYILENPVRAGIVKVFSDYPYSGSMTYSLQEIAEAVADGPMCAR